MAAGIKPRALGPMDNKRVNGGTAEFGIPFTMRFISNTTDSTYDWVNDQNMSMLVTRCYGYMTAAGAASDTAVVQQISGGTTTAITDTADLSTMSDTDQFDFSQINDAANLIAHGDTLRLTTASAAQCNVFVEGFWRQ